VGADRGTIHLELQHPAAGEARELSRLPSGVGHAELQRPPSCPLQQEDARERVGHRLKAHVRHEFGQAGDARAVRSTASGLIGDHEPLHTRHLEPNQPLAGRALRRAIGTHARRQQWLSCQLVRVIAARPGVSAVGEAPRRPVRHPMIEVRPTHLRLCVRVVVIIEAELPATAVDLRVEGHHRVPVQRVLHRARLGIQHVVRVGPRGLVVLVGALVADVRRHGLHELRALQGLYRLLRLGVPGQRPRSPSHGAAHPRPVHHAVQGVAVVQVRELPQAQRKLRHPKAVSSRAYRLVRAVIPRLSAGPMATVTELHIALAEARAVHVPPDVRVSEVREAQPMHAPVPSGSDDPQGERRTGLVLEAVVDRHVVG